MDIQTGHEQLETERGKKKKKETRVLGRRFEPGAWATESAAEVDNSKNHVRRHGGWDA
jgi:hypothetical protein